MSHHPNLYNVIIHHRRIWEKEEEEDEKNKPEPLKDVKLVEFLTKGILELSSRMVNAHNQKEEDNNNKQPLLVHWPFPPFSESGICSYDDDWDHELLVDQGDIDTVDTSHWTVESVAELSSSGVDTLSPINRQRLLVYLDFFLSKILYQNPTSYYETLHAISINTTVQPLSTYRLCKELGIWPSNFSHVLQSIVVPDSNNNKKDSQATPVVWSVLLQDYLLGIRDLVNIVEEYTRDLLPGTVVHKNVYLSEYSCDTYGEYADLFSGGTETWKVREFSLIDAKGHVWNFLAGSFDDGESDCFTLIRCAKTGIPLAMINALYEDIWVNSLQGFMYHSISTEFVLKEDDEELDVNMRENLIERITQWEKAYINKIKNRTYDIIRRMYVLQNKWIAACK